MIIYIRIDYSLYLDWSIVPVLELLDYLLFLLLDFLFWNYLASTCYGCLWFWSLSCLCLVYLVDFIVVVVTLLVIYWLVVYLLVTDLVNLIGAINLIPSFLFLLQILKLFQQLMNILILLTQRRIPLW